VPPQKGFCDSEPISFASATRMAPHSWSAPQHVLARELTEASRFYFVHSYCVTCESPADALALCTYGSEFAAAIASGAVAGVQFHPEKSHRFGLQLLKNFATA